MPSAGTGTPQPTISPGATSPSATSAVTPPSESGAPATGSPQGTPGESVPPTPAPTVPSAELLAKELASPGSLTVCLALVGAPAATLNSSDQVVGYNVAFADELSRRLGLQVVIQQADFGELVTDIQSHACDVSVSSQNITSDRTAQMSLIPYTQSKSGFPVVVAAGNPRKINTLEDLCGEIVSAAAGTTSIDQVNGVGDFTGRGLNDSCTASKKNPIDLRVYPSELDAVQALLDGTVKAYLGNANFVAQYPEDLQKSDALLPPFKQGIAVALDHPVLTTAVQVAIGEMIRDGSYLRILEQYLPSNSVDNFSIIDEL
jgi:polar amino acid transport system substrate-binding protein